MVILDWVREKIIKFLKLEHLSDNPTGDRYTFISSSDDIKRLKVKENKIWYYGNSDELLNFYTSQQAYGFNSNTLYNRNKREYFWALSSEEAKIKRVHSGLPHAIIDTLVNTIGGYKLSCENEELYKVLKDIEKDNSLQVLINQQEEPLTLATGYGAFKYCINREVSEHPIIEFYDAEKVEFIYKNKRLIGIVFLDYYKDDKGKDYVLLETRRIAHGNSYIEFALYRIKQNELEPVPLETLEETKGLSKDGYVIEGLNKILATPTIFFYDALNEGYGRSIFDGKIDLFDDYDQAISQQSQTVRVSTPIEYYDVESLRRNSTTGQPILPSAFNRQYIAKEPMRDGDGNSFQKAVETTQPKLNFEQYGVVCNQILCSILTGILSPASLGVDIAKKDNADAQREKEKITIMTRNNIIQRQIEILYDLFNKCIMLEEYIKTGKITIKDYEFYISYNEFATPTFENEILVLSNALQNQAISPEMYVSKLYGDNISQDVKERELQYLKESNELQKEVFSYRLAQIQNNKDYNDNKNYDTIDDNKEEEIDL